MYQFIDQPQWRDELKSGFLAEIKKYISDTKIAIKYLTN